MIAPSYRAWSSSRLASGGLIATTMQTTTMQTTIMQTGRVHRRLPRDCGEVNPGSTCAHDRHVGALVVVCSHSQGTQYLARLPVGLDLDEIAARINDHQLALLDWLSLVGDCGRLHDQRASVEASR